MNIIRGKAVWKNALDKRTKAQIKMIVIHHTAAVKCSFEDVQQWHYDRGWSGIGYHYFIRKDGTIYEGRPELTVGAHALNHNTESIGISCEGNYDTEKTMSDTQMKALVELVKDILSRYGELDIKKHKDVCSTDCPGDNFPWNQMLLAIHKPVKSELECAIDKLVEKGIIQSPEYWLENAISGKTINGEYAGILIKRVSKLT